jgi:hypothetical protein
VPCRYETPEEEARLSAQKSRAELDRLTAELDKTREALIASLEGREIDSKIAKSVEAEQRKHRLEDLDRLRKLFESLLHKVNEANPSKPLKPQLGFDPDDY